LEKLKRSGGFLSASTNGPGIFKIELCVECVIVGFVMRIKIIGWLFCVLTAFCAVEPLWAQGTAFTYQGQLNDGGNPATGNYDLRFAVFNALTNGNAIGVPLTNSPVAVSNGLFTTMLDFGAGVFTGTNYWLQIGVRINGDTNAFALLVPRQPILPVPYAVFANTASNLLGTLPSAQLSGTLPASAFTGYTNTVALTNGANLFSGAFTGNGTNLVNLNASQLAGGTVADARLSTNVPLLNANQAFSGANVFTNTGNSFSGSFFGNGLVGWIVTNGTAVQAQIDHGYLLTNSQLVTVTLPTAPKVGDIVRISGAGAGGWLAVANSGQSFIGNFSSYHNSLWLPAAVAGGVNWVSIAASADGTRMYAAGGTGVYASSDAGHTWSHITALAGGWNAVATSADGSEVFAVASGKPIQVSSNGGLSWSQDASIGSQNWLAIACSSDGTKGIASIKGGAVYISGNSGGSWAITSSGNGSGNWVAVAYSGDGSHYAAVNNGGSVYTSASGGSVAVAANLTALVSSTDGSKLATCASPGLIYTSTNSGVNWTPAASAPSANWNCLAASADCNRLVAGINGGGIYASVNFGAGWSALAGASNEVWSAVAASDDGDKLAGGVNTGTGGIFYSASSAQSATSTNTIITGSQGAAVELQFIGNGKFMPVSSAGLIWAN
jgi:hypothetical protein